MSQTDTANAAALPFTASFPAIDDARWRSLVVTALKGKAFETLESKTYDGIPVHPLYPAAKDAPIVPARAAGAWAVVQRVDHTDPAAANALALTDLENGAIGLHIAIAGSLGAYGFGLPGTQAALTQALENVYLDAEIPVELDLPAGDPTAAEALAEIIADRKIDPKSTRIAFGLDPLNAGSAGLAVRLAKQGFAGPFLVADARRIHGAGGSEAQELGYALAAALAGLRALEAAGMSLADAAKAISFRIAIDADEFLGIAKLRALRRLWAEVQMACGLTPATAHVHAETAWRMMTRRDPFVNMLRTSVAVFSAGIGGADRVSVLPFTQAIGLPDAFARRSARNTQLVLLEESHLARVADPAAGSGAFETLTQELCDHAWGLFQSIEKEGGLAAALTSGTLAKAVATTFAERTKNIARRKDALTGVSEFPDINETPVDVLAPLTPHAHGDEDPFPLRRLSEAFETLRDRSDAMLAKSGARPKVFLATLGKLSDYSARASFARNVFEAGGFTIVGSGEVKTADAIGIALRNSGAHIACICSSDALYGEGATHVARELKAAGAKLIMLAGRPPRDETVAWNETILRAAGIGGFLHAGGDILAALDQAWSA